MCERACIQIYTAFISSIKILIRSFYVNGALLIVCSFTSPVAHPHFLYISVYICSIFAMFFNF